MGIEPHELVIDDATDFDVPDMAGGARGLVPRDPTVPTMSATPFDLALIPRVEWPERIKDMEATKSRLSDIILTGNNGGPIPSKDQNEPGSRPPRWGYCWSYGTVGAVEALRAAMGLPYVSLSAFAVAYTIKGGRDEGAWGALSLDLIGTRGVPSERSWPNFSRSSRFDEADAALHKVVETWADLTAPVYNRDLTLDQKMTMLLTRTPVVDDYMWWGHCVYSCDPVDAAPQLDLMDPNRWASRDRNSWGDSYGDRGFFITKGRRCVPDNAVAPRLVNPSLS